jgi:AraC-like DNA-binding protein
VKAERTAGHPLPDSTRRSIASLLGALAPLEGSQASAVEGVTLLRLNRSVPRMPVLYEPSVVFVAQGTKRGFIGKRSFVYNANSYLVLSAPLPFECETEASEESPLLSLYVRLRKETISELLTRVSQERMPPTARPKTIESVPVDAVLADTVLRLLLSMQSVDDAKVLGPQLVREITYRVLLGSQGHALRGMVGFDGHFSQVCRALQQIHSDYAKDLKVAHLARVAGMSPSVFHLHFKAVASTSPVQYLKAVRLHKARTLMLDEGLGAASAAARVGYESPSQFGREFKRYFGHSPLHEASRLRSEPMID